MDPGDHGRQTVQFDSDLLNLTIFKEEEQLKADFDEWITLDLTSKNWRASWLLAKMIQDALGDRLTQDGLNRLANFSEAYHHLEQVTISTHYGLQRKFYRDHLNHIVRVAMLANAISRNIATTSSSQHLVSGATIAALFHDIAYPLEQFNETQRILRRKLLSCYSTPEVVEEARIFTKPSSYAALKSHLESSAIVARLGGGDKIKQLLGKNKHGALSALEFLSMLKVVDDDFDVDIASAILAHHETGVPISYSDDPIAAILILADELQEWGRPIGSESTCVLTRLERFALGDTIRASFNYEYSVLYPIFTSFSSKYENLKRVTFDDGFPQLQLEFYFQSYKKLNLARLLRILKRAYSELDRDGRILADYQYERYVTLEKRLFDIIETMDEKAFPQLFFLKAKPYHPQKQVGEAIVSVVQPTLVRLITDEQGTVYGVVTDGGHRERKISEIFTGESASHDDLNGQLVWIVPAMVRRLRRTFGYLVGDMRKENPSQEELIRLYETWLGSECGRTDADTLRAFHQLSEPNIEYRYFALMLE